MRRKRRDETERKEKEIKSELSAEIPSAVFMQIYANEARGRAKMERLEREEREQQLRAMKRAENVSLNLIWTTGISRAASSSSSSSIFLCFS